MAVAAVLLGTPPVTLWGLDSATRIARQLHSLGVERVALNAQQLNHDDTALVIDARYLFEVRTLAGLLRHPEARLECPGDGAIAAAWMPAQQLQAQSGGIETILAQAGATVLRPADLEGYDEQLRKVEPPLLRRISATNQHELESLLYGNAYKGITDLVTKWWWPRPARVVVGWCARSGVSPNMVTALGLLLVIVATLAFANGYYLSGLACGWLMTLLDTVDGKLARVTVQSSRIGHVLDHGMDILHPPFWYVFWIWGLGNEVVLANFSGDAVALVIVVGYIAGRLLEALFHALGACSMFAWRPFDAWFRLITARRNPCLILLTVATLAGRPDWAILAVTAWTVASSVIMALRLFYAAAVRLRHGPLQSWLRDPEHARLHHPQAYRTFAGTRRAYE